jgi:DNA-binding PadR family transcriptional regulator
MTVAEELWGAETRKAVDNFPVSGERVPVPVIRWLGRIKAAAARVNAELGLLEAETESEGRRRRTYRLTEEGRKELRAWLAEPTPEHFQMRDIAELKLFFNEVGDPGDVARLAREQVAAHRERIAVYKEMQARYADLDAVAKRMITLRLGLEMEHAALRFWSALLDETGS